MINFCEKTKSITFKYLGEFITLRSDCREVDFEALAQDKEGKYLTQERSNLIVAPNLEAVVHVNWNTKTFLFTTILSNLPECNVCIEEGKLDIEESLNPAIKAMILIKAFKEYDGYKPININSLMESLKVMNLLDLALPLIVNNYQAIDFSSGGNLTQELNHNNKTLMISKEIYNTDIDSIYLTPNKENTSVSIEVSFIDGIYNHFLDISLGELQHMSSLELMPQTLAKYFKNSKYLVAGIIEIPVNEILVLRIDRLGLIELLTKEQANTSNRPSLTIDTEGTMYNHKQCDKYEAVSWIVRNFRAKKVKKMIGGL